MEKLQRRHFLKQTAESLFARASITAKLPYVDPSNKVLPTGLSKPAGGIGSYTGVWGEDQVRHLLRRTMFGCTKADVDFFKGMSMSAAVDYLLNVPIAQPSPPLNNYGNNANTPDPNVPFGQTWVTAPVDPNVEFARYQSFKYWWAGLMVNQERNIREKMTLFWHNHFSTEGYTVQDSRYVYKHHALLRRMCLGNFKELVKEVTIDPAMLVYLNGESNTKTAPDENYGRELQELFTVGKDQPVHYTEDDVKQAARVLTGWRNNRNSISSFFDASKHDTADKTFSSFYNNTVITGRSGASAGEAELDDMLNMIFNQQEVAKYICRKIYRFFIYYVIDPDVESNIISSMADVFRNNNYEIKPVLEVFFKSEHFYDALSVGCFIKQPVDHIIGVCRQMNLVFPNAANIEQLYGHWQFIQQYTLLLNQDIGDPPNVAGWPAWYENPQYHELWINSDSLPKRNQFCDYMLYVGYSRFSYKLKFDCIAFAAQFDLPDDPNSLVSQVTELLYAVPLSQTSRDAVKTAFLLSGQSSDHYWTQAWNAYISNPGDVMAKATVETRLQAMLKYLMGLAEFQLC